MSLICTFLSTLNLKGTMTESNLYKIQVLQGTFMSFIVNNAATIGCFLLGTPPHYALTIGVSAVAALLFLISGAFAIEMYASHAHAFVNANFIGAGFLGLVNCIVFIRDMFATFKTHHRALRDPSTSVGI